MENLSLQGSVDVRYTIIVSYQGAVSNSKIASSMPKKTRGKPSIAQLRREKKALKQERDTLSISLKEQKELFRIERDVAQKTHEEKLKQEEEKHAIEVKELGQNIDSCLDNQETLSEVRKDIADGEAAGTQGTPYFVINGNVVSGAQPFENFKKIIDAELA